MKVSLNAHLYRQRRDDDDETSVWLKIPATDLQQAIRIPTRKLLKVEIEWNEEKIQETQEN